MIIEIVFSFLHNSLTAGHFQKRFYEYQTDIIYVLHLKNGNNYQ